MGFNVGISQDTLDLQGGFSLTGRELLSALSKALEPGHEKELRLVVKLFLFWRYLPDADRAQIIADLFELVRKNRITITPSVTLETKGLPA